MRYAYGWRPSPPDARDRKYSYSKDNSLPSYVNLREQFPNRTILNQGSLGSCGPQTLSENLLLDEMKQGVAIKYLTLGSRLFLYYNTRVLMGTTGSDSGVENRSMLKAVNQYGWCDEAKWPYQIKQYRTKPSNDSYQQALSRKVDQYLSVDQTLEAMLSCLAEGFPIIFGFNVYESFESDDVLHTGYVPLPSRSERQLGGHDVLIEGYDSSKKIFFFRNHYGADWGDHGYGSIGFEYCTTPSLSGDFWTVRFTPNDAPVTPPPPLPPPPPDPLPSPVPNKVLVIAYDAQGKEMWRK